MLAERSDRIFRCGTEIKMKTILLMVVLLGVVAEKPTVPVSPRPAGYTEPQMKELEDAWTAYFRETYRNLPADERPRGEREWQEFIRDKYEAVTEVSLFDGSRIDMVNSQLCIEIDWADKNLKWAEGVGQALWYASNKEQEPGLLLLVTDSIRANNSDSRALAAKRRRIKSNLHKAVTVCNKAGLVFYVEFLYRYTAGARTETTGNFKMLNEPGSVRTLVVFRTEGRRRATRPCTMRNKKELTTK